MKKQLDIDHLLQVASSAGPTKWELDTIVWNDRSTNPKTLVKFLQRIKELEISQDNDAEVQEFAILTELASEMDQDDCEELLSANDYIAKQQFLEDLARQGALQTLCNDQISIETMTNMCKLPPEDFILTAKRSQDLINSIRELVIQGETLSNDIAGA
jgi:hypothetical protein